MRGMPRTFHYSQPQREGNNFLDDLMTFSAHSGIRVRRAHGMIKSTGDDWVETHFKIALNRKTGVHREEMRVPKQIFLMWRDSLRPLKAIETRRWVTFEMDFCAEIDWRIELVESMLDEVNEMYRDGNLGIWRGKLQFLRFLEESCRKYNLFDVQPYNKWQKQINPGHHNPVEEIYYLAFVHHYREKESFQSSGDWTFRNNWYGSKEIKVEAAARCHKIIQQKFKGDSTLEEYTITRALQRFYFKPYYNKIEL